MMAAVVVIGASGCGNNERTSTSFCRQLAKEMPEIGATMNTKGQVIDQVNRYKRLLDVAPLSIEDDFRTLTDLLSRASTVDTNDVDAMQSLADAAYKANRASLNVLEWVKSTCAVDISAGVAIAPPRTAPPTTTTLAPSGEVSPSTTMAP